MIRFSWTCHKTQNICAAPSDVVQSRLTRSVISLISIPLLQGFTLIFQEYIWSFFQALASPQNPGIDEFKSHLQDPELEAFLTEVLSLPGSPDVLIEREAGETREHDIIRARDRLLGRSVLNG